MKNFRKTIKNFRKSMHKYFCEDFVVGGGTRLWYLITNGLVLLSVVIITASITRAVTIENFKNAQRDAMFNSMTEQMTECKTHATVPEQCTYEVTYDGDIITNIEVTYHGL